MIYKTLDEWADSCPLHQARINAGLTIYDLARRAQMSQTTLIKWADGSINAPRPENVAAVASVLGDKEFFTNFYRWIEQRPARELIAV